MLVHSHVWLLSVNDGNTKEADSSYVSLLHLLLSFLAAQQTQADLPLMLRALITNVTIKQGSNCIPFCDSDLGVTQHHLVHGGSSSHKHGQDGQRKGLCHWIGSHVLKSPRHWSLYRYSHPSSTLYSFDQYWETWENRVIRVWRQLPKNRWGFIWKPHLPNSICQKK